MIKEFIKMPLHIKLRRVRIKLYHFFCKKKWGGIGKGSIVEKPMFIMGNRWVRKIYTLVVMYRFEMGQG